MLSPTVMTSVAGNARCTVAMRSPSAYCWRLPVPKSPSTKNFSDDDRFGSESSRAGAAACACAGHGAVAGAAGNVISRTLARTLAPRQARSSHCTHRGRTSGITSATSLAFVSRRMRSRPTKRYSSSSGSGRQRAEQLRRHAGQGHAIWIARVYPCAGPPLGALLLDGVQERRAGLPRQHLPGDTPYQWLDLEDEEIAGVARPAFARDQLLECHLLRMDVCRRGLCRHASAAIVRDGDAAQRSPPRLAGRAGRPAGHRQRTWSAALPGCGPAISGGAGSEAGREQARECGDDEPAVAVGSRCDVRDVVGIA